MEDMNSPFVLTCLVLITVALWILIGVMIWTFIELRRASRAVEVLAYRVKDSVDSLHSISGRMHEFADNVRSGWMKAFELAIGAAQTFWSRRQEGNSHSEQAGDGKA
jgi:hypothetical protein